MFEYVLLLVFPAVMAFAGAMDLLTMTIPNRISVGLVAAFLLAAPLLGLSPEQFAMHVAAGLLVLMAGILLFAIGGFGGGDAKLLAAGALWIGFDQLLAFLVLTTVCGGLLAVAILFYRKLPLLGVYAPDWAIRLHKPGGGIPYGVAIAGSALLVFPVTPLVIASVA